MCTFKMTQFTTHGVQHQFGVNMLNRNGYMSVEDQIKEMTKDDI